MVWRAVDDGVILAVRVTPKSGRDGFGETDRVRDRLTIKVSAAPSDGEANEAVRLLIAKELKLSKSSVRLMDGAKSREKRFLLTGDSAEIIAKLEAKGVQA